MTWVENEFISSQRAIQVTASSSREETIRLSVGNAYWVVQNGQVTGVDTNSPLPQI